MKNGIVNIAWVAAVIILSAVVLSGLDRWEDKQAIQNAPELTNTALVMLIGYGGEDFPGSENIDSYKKVGCDDALVTYEIPVISKRLPSILNALSTFTPPEGLHNPMKEKGITLENFEKKPRGTLLIDLAGEPRLGGICDTPRLKGQIEETIKLYTDEYEILLNGDEARYRCLGDESGLCK